MTKYKKTNQDIKIKIKMCWDKKNIILVCESNLIWQNERLVTFSFFIFCLKNKFEFEFCFC
jgi:hypothetical protein